MRSTACAPLSPRRERLLIFKIVKISLVLTFFCLSAQSRSPARDQVTLKVKNATLEYVLKEIRRQTGFFYALQDQWKERSRPISLNVDHIALKDALDSIFSNQPFGYAIVGKTIVVKEKEAAPGQSQATERRDIPVRGTVYTDGGEALAGANVTIKETGRGTITNAQGEFTLSAAPLNGTLIFSYIGYAPQHETVKEGVNLKVYLKLAKDELDRAVVQAYGQTTQRMATGNIGTVRAEDIAKQPVMNVLDAIQGQVPGTIVTNTNGYASAQVKVEIRGRNTINPNFPSDPLYIIDGVPLTVLDVSNSSSYAQGAPGFIQTGIGSDAGGQSPLFSLNPNDIESIQVLKDADATAIYGSRGANGVILITTKHAKAGKSHFEINTYQGESLITRVYPMANTAQYIAMRKEALYNDELPVNINNSPDLVVGDGSRYTNWQKYVWGKPGTNTDLDASLTGGDAFTTFRISAGYRYERDLTAVSGGNSRGSVLLNLNHKSDNQRLNLGLSASYSYSTSNQISSPGSPNMPPDAPPIYNKLGALNYSGWDAFFDGLNSNPFFILLQPYTSGTNFLTSSFTINYEIFKGLTFRSTAGYNNVQTNQTLTVPIASQDPVISPTGAYSVGSTLIHNLIVEPQLEFNNYIKKGKLNILVGATEQKNITSGTSTTGSGIENDALLQQIVAAPTKFYSYGQGEYRYAGIFGRINYNWGNKYILNLNARRDGSSRFGPGRQYGNFGSVGAAWIFTEESWVKRNLSFLSFGKFRGSYGVTGGDQIGDYEFLSQWVFGNYPYNQYVPAVPIKHTDSLFHWQDNRKLEVGIDVSFLKDWISLGASAYINRTNDQLVAFPTPNFTGFGNVVTNSPANVENRGVEFILSNKIVDQKDFKLSTRFSVGLNRNRLVSYPNFAQSPYTSQFKIGQPLNIRRLLHCTGVDPQTGLYTFKDLNKDGQITYDPTGKTPDDSYIYEVFPKYDGSFRLELTYKSWQLSAFFYFRKQLGNAATASLDIPGDMTNQATEVLNNHWERPGQIARYARFTTNPSDVSFFNYTYASDGALTDASFIRMQNLDLSYGLLRSTWLPRGFQNARIEFRAQNLLVITKYKGSDPEIQNFNSMPLPKIITLGISFTF